MSVTLTPSFLALALSAAARLVVSWMSLMPCGVDLRVVMEVGMAWPPKQVRGLLYRSLLLLQQYVHRPAPPYMDARLLAVVQDFSIVAPGFFQGVSEDRKTVECTLVVDSLCELNHGAVVPGEPGRVN